MCRNIQTLYNFDPAASEEDVHAAALQYVRKVSGYTKPSRRPMPRRSTGPSTLLRIPRAGCLPTSSRPHRQETARPRSPRPAHAGSSASPPSSSMAKLVCDISVSLDGFVAGRDATLEQPLGEGGEPARWVVKTAGGGAPRTARRGGRRGLRVVVKRRGGAGAYIMGRRMFSGGAGPWEDDPNPDAWWGDEPPFHAPVFVLTHHDRKPVVRGGPPSISSPTGSRRPWRRPAPRRREKDIYVCGRRKASCSNTSAAGLLDELQIHMASAPAGGGTPALRGARDGPARPSSSTRVIESPVGVSPTFAIASAARGSTFELIGERA